MAVTPLGNIILVNQNMHVAAGNQIDYQNRIEFQNVAAAVAANEKQRQIEETRETEEGHKIDPDREHFRERADEETGEKEQETAARYKKKRKEKEEESSSTFHILDIKV
ncbi:MAG: hypothetical protein B6D59_04230 [Campylobacteraceae bacterium 4484_4]|nr:MAG: hypothetical protein B6D59_04230 [Campylobacteraceae bacterium 4484_4]